MHTPPIDAPPVTICLPPLEITYMGRLVTWVESMGREHLLLYTAKQVSIAATFLFMNLSVIGIPLFIHTHREWLKLKQDHYYREEFAHSRMEATEQFNAVREAWGNHYKNLSENYTQLSERVRILLMENRSLKITSLEPFTDPSIESFERAELPHMQFLGLKPRPYIGRFIIWIESWKNHGFIFRFTMKALLTLGCIVANVSVIGIPLFLWGNREWTQRNLYRCYNDRFSDAYNIANQELKSAKSEWMKNLKELAEKNAKLESMIQKSGSGKEET